MEQSVTEVVVGVLIAIAGGWLTVSKIKTAFMNEIHERIEKEVQNARNIAEGDLKSVELKIDNLSKDIDNLEKKIEGDIDNVKSIYNSEIKSLAEKIESLRDQVQTQHSQLVDLLTRLISGSK